MKFLTTADPVKYYRMMVVASRTTRLFCERNGYEFESYVGIRRGRQPWHARFNRIDMLSEHLESGFKGWLVYLDADSFVADLSFDFTRYLERYAGHGLIARAVKHPKVPTWRINDGVMIINTAHPDGVWLIRTWKKAVDGWSRVGQLHMPPRLTIPTTQRIMQYLLWRNPAVQRRIHFEDPHLINSNFATFIAQILLSDQPDFEARLAEVRAQTDRCLAAYGIHPSLVEQDSGIPAAVVAGLYRALLGREADPGGLETYAAVVRRHGLREGSEKVARELVGSAEFARLAALDDGQRERLSTLAAPVV